MVSAEQGNDYFPILPRSRLRNWSRETGSAVPSCVSLLISILRLNLFLTYEIPPEFRGGVHLFIQNHHIRHRISPEFIGSRKCVPMAFTAESSLARRASKPQGSSERMLACPLSIILHTSTNDKTRKVGVEKGRRKLIGPW